jgi:hypothetical protein
LPPPKSQLPPTFSDIRLYLIPGSLQHSCSSHTIVGQNLVTM